MTTSSGHAARFGVLDNEGAAGEHPDLGVDRFDAGVGEPVGDGGEIPARWSLIVLANLTNDAKRDLRARASQAASIASARSVGTR